MDSVDELEVGLQYRVHLSFNDLLLFLLILLEVVLDQRLRLLESLV